LTSYLWPIVQTPPSQPPWGKFAASDWHKVVLPESEKVLRHLGRDQQERLRDAIERLPEGHVVRLKGTTNEYRLRVGDWRVRFLMDKAQRRLVILAVGSRGSVYKAR
jgi:mRNA interferase RelE/StbE